jgi:hypothetical protein
VMMRPIALTALLAATLLAGCSGNDPSGKSSTDPTFDDLGLTATSSTGLVRGVVVDDAIRPIAGARIVLSGGDSAGETVSTEAGTFGFSNLLPGTYFLAVSKPGFFAAQQSVDVVAGVEEPAIAKVLLQIDAANQPFFEARVFEGYIECSGTFVAVGAAVCSFPNGLTDETGNVTQDNFGIVYQLSKKPTWLQSEMVWESTQALGGKMSVMYSWDCGDDNGGFLCDHGAAGTSPLLLTANATDIDRINGGDYDQGVFVRAFNEGLDETRPAGIPGGGLGFTFQQRFTIYTHAFYGYQPPEGWRLSSGEPVPLVPA